jgi:hypothetical protein
LLPQLSPNILRKGVQGKSLFGVRLSVRRLKLHPMPKHTLIVTFPALQGFENVHRIRNFAEEMHRHFMRNEQGTLEEVDTITDELRIFIPKARFLGEVVDTLNAVLKKHNLFDDAVVMKRQGIHESE